jgi:cell division protease FtsH
LEEYYAFIYGNIVKFGNDIDGLFNYLISESGKISMDYTLDLSKCLIFVAGNVDEAFSGLTHNMDNEMLTPDQFYEISSQVNFNVIKESLLWRFKPEQVARLGTNHVIFPSFNTKMYTKFIEKLHQRTKDNFKEFGIKIEIDDSVTQFILTHAAIPSQGSRSVLSAHEYLVDSNIPEALAKSLLTKGKKFTIAVDVDDNILIVTNKDIIVKEITIIDKTVLENYSNHDLNYTISLHEAAHSIVGIAVMGVLPDVIKTRLSNGEVGGYCKFAPEEGIMTRNEAVGRIALAMGGYAGEIIRKGFDNVSIGSSSDILSATGLASALVKVLGLGSSVVASGFSMGRDGLVSYDKDEMEKQVEELVEEGLFLAFNALEFYDKEHKALTKILMKQPTTRAKDIKHLF